MRKNVQIVECYSDTVSQDFYAVGHASAYSSEILDEVIVKLFFTAQLKENQRRKNRK